jgi:hypothetical protein
MRPWPERLDQNVVLSGERLGSEGKMPIDLTCPCGKRLRVTDEATTQQGQCPVCGRLLEIPTPHAVAPSAPPQPAEGVQALPPYPPPAGATGPDAQAYAEAPPPGLPAWPMPEAPAGDRPPYKLYAPGYVALAAFLGGPIGAFLLLALNYKRLGRGTAAALTVLCGLLTVAALVALDLKLPESSPTLLLALPVFLILWLAAKLLQGRAFDRHVEQRGELASGWAAAGFGLLGLALFCGVSVGAFRVYEHYLLSRLGTRIDFGGGAEIFFTQGATEADARALGAFLREAGVFDGRRPMSVQVSRDGDRVGVSIIIADDALNDPNAERDFREFGQEASQKAFGGRPVEVRLCDPYFNVKKRIR